MAVATMTMTRRRLLLSGAMALLAATLAGGVGTGDGVLAADAAAVRVRGQVTAAEGRLLTVRTREGATERVELAPEGRVLAVAPSGLGAIEAGTYVGTAAVPGSDGRLTALEVLVFPDAMRGANEGHFAWDLAPESTMTNATVATTTLAAEVDGAAGAAGGDGGRVLTLRYPGGERTVVVSPEAPVVAPGPGEPELLRPGSHVFVPGATRRTDGVLTAGAVVVGRDGLVPPM